MNSISVSRLAVACDNPEYLALLQKDPQSVPPFLKSYSDKGVNAAPGHVFHELASSFVEFLSSGNNSVPAFPATTQELWDALYKNLAKENLFRIASSNAESASNLSGALRHFCGNIHRLAASKPGDWSWPRLFIASEFAIKNVIVTTSRGSIEVNGRIDNLRSGSSGLELVDYKLSQGVNRSRDLIQLALYGKLLKLSRHAISVDGILEYYHPELFVTQVPYQELDRIFADQVIPIIDSLIEGWSVKQPGPVSKDSDSTTNSGSGNDMLLSGSDKITIPARCLRTHTAVVGAAGSGKTWMAKIFAEEAILARTPVIAVDPQGDLVQIIKSRNPAEIPNKDLPRYRQFWDLVEPRIYTPGTTHGIRLSLEPIRLINPEQIRSVADEQRRREEVDAILNETANAIVGLGNVTPREVPNLQSLTFAILKHLTNLKRFSLTLRELAEIVKEPESISFPESVAMFTSKANQERFARSLFAVANGPSASLFEGGQPLDIGQLLRTEKEGRIPFNVIYLNALSDQQKAQFIASLSTAIYRWMITSIDSGDAANNLLFYLDEARDYLPAGTKSTPCKQPLIRLFTQGRKFGVGCLICTQSPRSVDFNVFGNCSTKMIGRLEAAQDVERVAEWFQSEGGKPSWLASRVGAEKGSFVGRWPDQLTPMAGKPFNTRMLYTSHSDAWAPHRVELEWREFLERSNSKTKT